MNIHEGKVKQPNKAWSSCDIHMKFKPYFPKISGKISQKSSPTVENVALKVNPLYSGNPF